MEDFKLFSSGLRILMGHISCPLIQKIFDCCPRQLHNNTIAQGVLPLPEAVKALCYHLRFQSQESVTLQGCTSPFWTCKFVHFYLQICSKSTCKKHYVIRHYWEQGHTFLAGSTPGQIASSFFRWNWDRKKRKPEGSKTSHHFLHEYRSVMLYKVARGYRIAVT